MFPVGLQCTRTMQLRSLWIRGQNRYVWVEIRLKSNNYGAG